MSQFSYPKCTDDIVRSPGYINGLLDAVRRSFNIMGSNNFGGASMVPASLADEKSVMQIFLTFEGTLIGAIANVIISLVNIPEIENPSDEGIVLESLFGVVQSVIGGNATLDIYRYPAAGGPSLLKTLTFVPGVRGKVSDKTVSQSFKKDDLLVMKLNIAGAGDSVANAGVACNFVTPHATT